MNFKMNFMNYGMNLKMGKLKSRLLSMQSIKSKPLRKIVSAGGKAWKENKILPEKLLAYNESWRHQNTSFSELFNHLWETANIENSFYKNKREAL